MSTGPSGPAGSTDPGPAPEPLSAWVGRREISQERLAAAPLRGLAATLDRDEPEPQDDDELPPLAHWLYFLPRAPQHEIGPDGHPRRGAFLPPVDLPRRMWAGGRLRFARPLRVGMLAERRSTIASVEPKQGRSGAMVFVTVWHEIGEPGAPAVIEEHDIVYREAAAPGAPAAAPQPAPTDEDACREIRPDAVLLFRYSALTFNGHRIHYDRAYATEVEGYPGLVVHGPLIATLLVDLLRRTLPGERIASFGFRAVSPLFDTAPFQTCLRRETGGRVSLWARNPQGRLAMQAEAELG